MTKSIYTRNAKSKTDLQVSIMNKVRDVKNLRSVLPEQMSMTIDSILETIPYRRQCENFDKLSVVELNHLNAQMEHIYNLAMELRNGARVIPFVEMIRTCLPKTYSVFQFDELSVEHRVFEDIIAILQQVFVGTTSHIAPIKPGWLTWFKNATWDSSLAKLLREVDDKLIVGNRNGNDLFNQIGVVRKLLVEQFAVKTTIQKTPVKSVDLPA